jgi:hypothetical protein
MKLNPKIVMVGRGIFQNIEDPTTDRAVPMDVRLQRIAALKAKMG